MKKLLVLLFLLLMLFLICGTGIIGQLEEEEVLTLNFIQVVETAFSNNVDWELELLRMEEIKREHELVLITGEEEEIESSEEKVETAEANLLLAEENLILQIEQRYRSLLAAEDNIVSREESLLKAEREHELNQLRFERGYISEVDLKKSVNSLLATQLSFQNQKQSLLNQRYRFNVLLGLPLTVKVKLVNDLEIIYEPLVMTFEEALETAFFAASRILTVREGLAAAIDEVRRATSEYVPLIELERADRNRRRAEIDLIKVRNSLYLDVMIAHFDLAQKEQNIELLKREKEIARINYQVSLAQYEKGEISEESYNNRKNALDSALKSINDAYWDYRQDKRDFLELIGTPEVITRKELGIGE